jgi:uncharacterized protein
MGPSAELAQLADRIVASRSADVPSPCVSVCRMDPHTGLCEGCCRTIDEIAAWSALGVEGRRAVWQRIAERSRTRSTG